MTSLTSVAAGDGSAGSGRERAVPRVRYSWMIRLYSERDSGVP